MRGPRVLVGLKGGVVTQISTNVAGLTARVLDLDKLRARGNAISHPRLRPHGEPLSPELQGEPEYLTPDELRRLTAECEQFSKVGVMRMMNNATAAIPGATAAIRAWLEEAEAESHPVCEACGKPGEYHDEVILCPEHEPKDAPDPPEASLFADHFASPIDPDSPDYDAGLNNLVRNGPWE